MRHKNAAIRHINAAGHKLELDDFIGALEDCDSAIKNDPTAYVAYYYSGLAKIGVHNRDAAIQDFNKAWSQCG